MLQPAEFVLYLRKSKGRAGIARQRRDCRRRAEELGVTIVAEFSEADTTAYAKPGQRARRDQYAAMLAMLRTDRRDTPLGVMAWHTDRLNRSPSDAEEFIAIAAEGGHIVETARAGTYDLSTPTGRKRFRQDAVDAAYEVDHMTERIEAAKIEAAAEGVWFGGRRPFGYKKDGTRHKRAEADAIDAGADAVLAEVTVTQIARDWNAAGLTGTRGAPWTGTTVRRVLLNPRNAGYMIHRGKVVGEATWLPVLCARRYRPPKGVKLDAEVEERWRAEAKDKWRAVAAVLTDPERRTSPGPERKWLGSGLYRCGYLVDGEACGRPVKIGAAAGPRRRTVYRCSGEARHVVRDAVILDAYVTGVLCERLARPDAAELLDGESDVDASRLRVEIKALADRKAELVDMFNAGDIDAAQLKRGTAGLNAEIGEKEGVLASLVQTSALTGIAGEADAAGIFAGLDLHRRRAVLAATLEVTILPAPKGRPKGHVKGRPYFHPEAIGLEWAAG